MAFATANVKAHSGGSLNWLAGDWSDTLVGSASGSIVVGGSRVYFAQFNAQDAVSGELTLVPWTASTSANLTTITVHNKDIVATGRFLIAYS